MFTTYSPEPYVDFTQPEPREKMLAALEQVRGELGQTYKIWLDGKAVTAAQTFDSTSPADPGRVVGTMCKSNVDHADAAVRSAAEAFKDLEPRGA